MVGEDFPEEHLDFLRSRQVDLAGLQRAAGRTFRWQGRYGYDLNEAQTLDTQLNVFETFRPEIPEAYRDAEFVFLANIDPELQLEVLRQVRRPKLVACDTMNFWISGKRQALLETLRHVDILVINEGEARQLAEEPNLVKAARSDSGHGAAHPGGQTRRVRGDHVQRAQHLRRPGLSPGRGLRSRPGPATPSPAASWATWPPIGDLEDAALRRAIVFGSVMASFTVEDFSLNRLRTLDYRELEERYARVKLLTEFTGLS